MYTYFVIALEAIRSINDLAIAITAHFKTLVMSIVDGGEEHSCPKRQGRNETMSHFCI